MSEDSFYLTEDHIKLLRHAFTEDNGGVPSLGSKRPFGNSDVYGDVIKILGISYDECDDESVEDAYLMVDNIMAEMPTVLAVMLRWGGINPGPYISKKNYGEWRPDEL